MGELDRIQLRVVGRVQGVGFRYFVQTRAQSLGLRGWVQNEDDGSVIVLAEGDTRSLESLQQSVTRGPRGARVDSVVREPVADAGPLREFKVRYPGW
jgi:acylphosphatase